MLHGSEPGHSPFDVQDAQAKGADGSVQILVPLFLILITFFIVLNAISNQKLRKAGLAVESVNTAFRGADKPYLPPVDGIDLLAVKERNVHHDLFYEQSEVLLQALVDFPGQFAARGGNVMQVELGNNVLFNDADDHVRADQTLFLNSLADLLKKQLAGEERSVEIMLAVRPAAFSKDAGAAKLAVARAASLARELEDRGVPGRSITTGLVPDKRNVLWLTLTNRSHAVMERDRKGAPGP